MLVRLRELVTAQLMNIEQSDDQPELQHVELPEMEAHHIDATTGLDEMEMIDAALSNEGRAMEQDSVRRAPRQTRRGAGPLDPNDPSTWGRVPRNKPCPCGSGKKYKHCHGKRD